MFHLLVLATVLSVCVADKEAQATASPQIMIHNDYQRLENQLLRQGLERVRHELNIPSNPHSHMDDPYRQQDNLGKRGDEYDNRGNQYDNRGNQYDNRGNQYDNRRDEYSYRRDENNDRRDGMGDGRDQWQGVSKKPVEQWWTDKDRIEHVDDDQDIKGPVILRTIKSHENRHKPDIARQNKIIEDVYSPDYAQPTWIIDYRYLKTGGRDYTRGPGGQIIILPKGIRTNEHKEFKNYDELIENLRQQNLAERSKPQYFMPLGQEINQQREDYMRDDKRWYN